MSPILYTLAESRQKTHEYIKQQAQELAQFVDAHKHGILGKNREVLT